MKTIINTSFVTDYSGETPITTYSNPVTTVIRRPAPAPVITTRVFCCQSGECCDCGCNCDCGCGCWQNECNCGWF